MHCPSIGRRLATAALAASLLMGPSTTSWAQGACSAPKDLFLNPFSRDSAHHRPIGTGAQYAGDSHPATRDWLKANSFAVNLGDTPWGLYMVQAPRNGPVLTVNRRPGTPGSQLPADVRFPPGGVNLDFPPNRDGNVAIFDTSSGRFQHIRNYAWNNGSPLGSQYRNYDPAGLGHGIRMGQRLGTSASGVAAPFGILRGFEINTPGHRIGHALQMGLPSQPGCKIMLSRDIILPATSRDGFANNSGHNTGNIPYGAVMALPQNININSLGLSEPGRQLAEAIRDYGIYVVDTAGCGGGAIRADQDINQQVLSKLRSDIPKIYRHVRMVLNSEWRPGQSAVGGGQPIAPNCAYNAGATNVAAPSTPQSSNQPSSGSSSSKQASGGSSGSSTPSTGQSSGGGGSQAGAPSGPDWQKAVRFYEWAMMAYPNTQRFAPGTPQYERAKSNYDRNIKLYIQYAAKAGVKVDANTPPDQAVAGQRASNTQPANSSSNTSRQQQASTSTSGNEKPAPGTAEAGYWQKAVQFYEWAMMAYPNMQRLAPGTPGHEQAKANYERNMRNYIAWAGKAGITVSADTPPDRAFG